ncbi:hypothetical protein [Arthrobacter sp. P2b]|uniref:hypothetical protein n=1 Tax=Arthrobacter sp. P2b TaxID=1938741 RepID=UPI0009A89EF6|nr:hypothetical protein [Arthrobacter sp. P2b]
MKTSVLGYFAATTMLALSATACGGPANTPAVNSPAPESSVAASTVPAATPTPTATPKAYTSEELAVIVRQLRDSADRRLTAVPGAELEASLEQAKAMMNSVQVEPAECKELAASSTLPTVDGAAMATGLSTDAGTGSVTAVSLLAGLDKAALEKVADPSAQLEKCSQMTMTAEGVVVVVTLTPLDGAAGTTAYRTDSQLPDGQVRSIVTAQAVHHGVVITAVTSGEDAEAGASRAAALLESAGALIK